MSSPHLTAHTRVQGGMTCSSLPITVEEHRSKYNQNINLLSAMCSSSAVLVSDFIPQTQESFIFHLHLLCYWGGQVWPAVPIFSWIHDSWAVTLCRISGGKHLHLLPRFSPGIHPRVVSLGTSDTPTDHSCKRRVELREEGTLVYWQYLHNPMIPICT